MSTNNDGWILMSERKPTEADLPVWVYYSSPEKSRLIGVQTLLAESDHILKTHCPVASHWKPAAADIPAPPREKTQEEKDGDAYGAWTHTRAYVCAEKWEDVWHAALAYERAEVGKMLPPHELLSRYSDMAQQSVAAIEAIRARCGGGK